MSYFVFDGILEVGQFAKLTGEEAQHLIHSRRVKKGEMIELQDQRKQHFQAILEEVTRRQLAFQVQKSLPALPPSALDLEVLLGLPKEKALDWIIQKVTELGGARFLIFKAHYSPRNMSVSQQEKLRERWKKIAQEACKQSGRQLPPEIRFFPNLEELLSALPPCSQQWVLSREPSANTITAADLLKLPASLSSSQRILIGPEGGLATEELAMAYQAGMKGIHLGARILRSETAVVAMTSILQFLFGDLGRGEKDL